MAAIKPSTKQRNTIVLICWYLVSAISTRVISKKLINKIHNVYMQFVKLSQVHWHIEQGRVQAYANTIYYIRGGAQFEYIHIFSEAQYRFMPNNIDLRLYYLLDALTECAPTSQMWNLYEVQSRIHNAIRHVESCRRIDGVPRRIHTEYDKKV